jgi:trehalose 6-phosphate synthase/phosphatase
MLLGDALSNQPLEVIEGRKVIEVRLRGVSKAVVAHRVYAECVASHFIMAIGDDRTDEDLFRALPSSSATVVVGHRPSCARFRVADHRDVRGILRALVSGAQALHPTGMEAESAPDASNRGMCLVGIDDS